jgi:hypothetical protein
MATGAVNLHTDTAVTPLHFTGNINLLNDVNGDFTPISIVVQWTGEQFVDGRGQRILNVDPSNPDYWAILFVMGNSVSASDGVAPYNGFACPGVANVRALWEIAGPGQVLASKVNID